MSGSVSKERFERLLAIARERAAANKQTKTEVAIHRLQEEAAKEPKLEVDLTSVGIKEITNVHQESAAVEVISDIMGEPEKRKVLGVARDDIILNSNQQLFCDTVVSSKDVVLIGAAGTGKTTSVRQTSRALIESGKLPRLSKGTKYLVSGHYGATVLSYTRKAVNNIRHAVVDELKDHVLTIHKLLEFAPVFYEIEDPDNKGEFKKTMRFEPQRNEHNPLPDDLVFILIEESSMVSVELYQLLQKALPHPHQEVFLGDIQQLPPIFGLAILGFKLLELPVIELTEVYRQALDSPIISLAWKILEGNPHEFSGVKETYTEHSEVLGKKVTRIRCPGLDKYTKSTNAGTVRFNIWQKQLSADYGLNTAVKQFTTWEDQGYYNANEDVILCPFNKAFGTIELNKGIAQHLGVKRGATVFEVIAGFNKHYLAVGDRVLYDKEDAYVESIRSNGEYLGKRAQPSSKHLDRWGHYREQMSEQEQLQATVESDAMDLTAIEKFMDLAADASEDRVQAASHVVTIRYAFDDGDGDEIVLDSAAEINNLLGGYALTIHKFQGSEAEKVFLVLHNTHAVMVSRELLYTAVTRAKKWLHIIAEPDTFFKGVRAPRIKGNTIAEKAEFFKGKKETLDRLKAQQISLDLTHHSMAEKPKTVQISGRTAIKLEDIPSIAIKLEADNKLAYWWNIAMETFDNNISKIGEFPTLDYKISNRRTVGRAYFNQHRISLNPVWLAAAEKDDDVRKEMLENTIIHEICHLVAAKKFRDRKHGVGWKICMQKMGRPVSGIDPAKVPDWVTTKNSLLTDILITHNAESEVTNEEETEKEGEVT